MKKLKEETRRVGYLPAPGGYPPPPPLPAKRTSDKHPFIQRRLEIKSKRQRGELRARARGCSLGGEGRGAGVVIESSADGMWAQHTRVGA